MSVNRFDSWVRTPMGYAVAGAQVFICTQPCTVSSNPSPQAQLFSDPAGTIPISQPLLADGYGHVSCYLSSGLYTVVYCDRNVLSVAYADQQVGTGTLMLPVTITPIDHNFVTGYDANTGIFVAAQPAFIDLIGAASAAQQTVMIGDTGTGGVQGAVPAPPAGSAAALKYLCADGTFSVPSGTGVGISSVGLSTDSSFLTVSNSPLVANGTIALNLTSGLTQNRVLATPDGVSGTVSLRALVANDIPSIDAGKIGSGVLALARGGNTFTLLGDLIYGGVAAAPTILLGQTSATKKFLTQTGTGSISAAPSWSTIVASDLPSLSSVAVTSLSGDSTVFNNSSSQGAVTLSLISQSANKVLAGPTSGGAVAPTFRSLVIGDLPSLTSVAVTSLTGDGNVFNNAASQGAVTLSLASQVGNIVLVSPNGSSGAPSFRALLGADLPTRTVAVSYVIDGGGSVPTTGVSYGQITIPVAMTISKVVVTSDASGSCQLDLKYCTSATFPGSLTSIVASAPPKLVSQQISTDSTLTGWTTSLAANSQLQFLLTSATTVTRINVTLYCTASYS